MAIISVIIFLLFIVAIVYEFNQRKKHPPKITTHLDYLWRLKEITDKSEYEIFVIAGKEKGWPEYQVKKHFKRYLADQTLPVYVKQFLEEGQDHIRTYRSERVNLLDKRVLVFFAIFALVAIGGSLFISLYIMPRYYQYDYFDGMTVTEKVRPYVNRAISHAQNQEFEKACLELKKACEIGYCEYLELGREEGLCP